LTILHVTDLHVTRPGVARAWTQRILAAVAAEPVDLVALTGDYMTRPGQEPAAVALLRRLARTWTSRYGAYAILGNHDSSDFARIARGIPGITWLENQYAEIPGLPLTILGLSYPEDLLSTMMGSAEARRDNTAPDTSSDADTEGGSDTGSETCSHTDSHADSRADSHIDSETNAVATAEEARFRLLLSHYPTEIFPAASAGIPLMLAGHTHGGQLRMASRLAPHTSCDLPPHHASGILQLDETLCVISRGLGEAVMNFRINCPPQMPLLTLRRGPLPAESEHRLVQVRAW
jgi:predicted MPP superfamily phosphohydrolase